MRLLHKAGVSGEDQLPSPSAPVAYRTPAADALRAARARYENLPTLIAKQDQIERSAVSRGDVDAAIKARGTRDVLRSELARHDEIIGEAQRSASDERMLIGRAANARAQLEVAELVLDPVVADAFLVLAEFRARLLRAARADGRAVAEQPTWWLVATDRAAQAPEAAASMRAAADRYRAELDAVSQHLKVH